MSSPGTSWKAEERRVCKRLGIERKPSNGREQDDAELDRWSLEMKKRKELPGGIAAYYKQAMRNAPDGKTPICIMSNAPGSGIPIERFVLVDFEAFADLLDRAGDLPESAS